MADLVPAKAGQIVSQIEIVRANIAQVLAQNPQLCSFDLMAEENESLKLRSVLDPGILATERDGWSGFVNNWNICPYDVTNQQTGEVDTVPSLALFTPDGQLVRLTGWPAIKSWLRLVDAATPERCSLGIRVRVVRRPSGTAGRSYWQVLPD